MPEMHYIHHSDIRKVTTAMKCASVVFMLVSVVAMSPGSASESEGWISLFDGKTLNGWKAGENPQSFRVQDGVIACDGDTAHLFYVGEVENADFNNFEFKVDVMTRPGANSGIYVHTAFQEKGWPEQGHEVQINNSYAGQGNYRELKMTGSVYGVRNQYKSIAPDNEWFTVHITVVDNHITTRVNDMVLADYVEEEPPIRGREYQKRRLSSGTFAFQCHDPESRVFYKNVYVKPLPNDLESEAKPPVVDDVYTRITRLNEQNFPIVDYHVHLKGNFTLEDALNKSRETGIYYGIAINCGIGFPITTDQQIFEFVERMKGLPVFLAMQGEGREWVETFSGEAREQFDYVFSDALTFTDDQGRRTRIWIPEETYIDDKQQFMDMYVDRIVSVISNEPIDLFVNPTFLPDSIAADYDVLWTEERMQKVIDAAANSKVAIEINDRYRIPSAKFIKMAKKAGVKFSFGTNNGDENFGRLEYCLQMMEECGLTGNDMFVPSKK